MVDKRTMREKKHVQEYAVLRQEETVEKTTVKKPAKEVGGYQGPEPTRYGDWEKKGRCIDF